MTTGAIFDPSGQYRYLLWREWDYDAPRMTFVMLNPSTADATRDDPTIRRCISFARKWAYGSLDVVNLFAYRATDPAVLARAEDPIGPENEWYLRRSIKSADKVVLAWGNHGALRRQYAAFQQAFPELKPFCLGLTQTGQPKHPLYVAINASLVPY